MTRRIVLVATHPIQYQVPWFRALAQQPGLELVVLYASLPDDTAQGVGFDVPFSWDVPLFEGYPWRALANAYSSPRLDRFFGSRVRGLGSVLHELAPDAVVITGWNQLPLLQALAACRARAIPAIVRGESNDQRARPWLARTALRALLSRFQAFLTIGTANRAFYLARGVPAGRIVDAPYAVDNERFARQAAELRADRDAVRGQLGIPPGAACLAFVGKLIAKKRPLDLVEAAARCSLTRPLHLLIVGDGDLRQQVAARSRSLGMNATFTGFLNQSEIARAYVASDCLVLPSDEGETWGLVVNEAMACGVPAIVSDRVGCGVDLVLPGETGERYPCADVAGLAAAIAAMAAEPADSARMGARAQQRVVEQFSLARTVTGTLEAIEIACSPRAARTTGRWVTA